jgi:ABC-type amino acid transport substrate-binding protein
LKGKTIAAPLGIYAPIIARQMARADDGAEEGEHLSDEDFKFTNVGYYLVDALAKGKADAAFAAFENYEMIEDVISPWQPMTQERVVYIMSLVT